MAHGWKKACGALLMSSWLLLGALSAMAGDDSLAEARTHFRAGVALLQDPEGPRYEEAYREFKVAFDVSGSPKVLGNLGLCAMKLERDGEAMASYERYLAEVDDIDPEERAQIESDLELLKVRSAHVDIVVDAPPYDTHIEIVDTRTPIQGDAIRNVYLFEATPATLVVRPGHHQLLVKVEGQRQEWELDVVPGERITRHVTLVSHEPSVAATPHPPPRTPRPVAALRTAERPAEEGPSLAGPILVLGIGAAALVVGGVLGIAALVRTDEIEELCPGNRCPPEAGARLDDAHDYVRAADYTLLAGGVVAAVGLGWLIGVVASDAGDAPSVAMSCSAGGCMLEVPLP